MKALLSPCLAGSLASLVAPATWAGSCTAPRAGWAVPAAGNPNSATLLGRTWR